MRCDAELCEFWTGMGCACAVFGIERDGDDAEAPDQWDFEWEVARELEHE